MLFYLVSCSKDEGVKKDPIIAAITPNVGVVGATVIIDGTFFSLVKEENIVNFGSSTAIVKSVNSLGTQLEVTVPPGDGVMDVSVTINGKPISNKLPFTYSNSIGDAVVSTILPDKATEGNKVTITGSFFSSIKENNTVRFGSTQATVLTANNEGTQLEVKVPEGTGTVELSVTVRNKTAINKPAFTHLNPSITSITPTKALTGQTVTIQGEFYSTSKEDIVVRFGDTATPILLMNSESTQLMVNAPEGNATTEVSVTVRGKLINNKPSFTYLKSIAGIANCPTCPLTENFAGNFYSLDPVFTIDGKAYIRTTSEKFYEFNPTTTTWTEKQAPDLLRAGQPAFSIGSKGYVMDRYELWEYDPATDKWSKKTNHPLVNAEEHSFAFVINGKAYVGGTTSVKKDMYKYDPMLNTWTKVATYPGSSNYSLRCYFTLNGKGYAGGGVNAQEQAYQDFWEYDATQDKWTQKNDLPFTDYAVSSLFEAGGKGYASYANFNGTNLWVYDPAQDHWEKSIVLPGTTESNFYSAGFSLGNVGYYLLQDGSLFKIANLE